MRPAIAFWLVIMLALSAVSCRNLKEYFREPDTENLVETIQSTVLTGYAANMAMLVMDGESYPNVTVSRSNTDYPCTARIEIDLTGNTGFPFSKEKASTITVAGLWADESTAVLTLLYTDYQVETTTLDLVGIETIPVIRENENLHIAMASQDIRLNPDQESLLQINLTTLEIESELLRLDVSHAADVYVAIAQNAYVVEVIDAGMGSDPDDDRYVITGGGQLITVAGNDAEIIQMGMVDVAVTPACEANPVDGMALVKVTGVEEKGFPELGTAIFEFHSGCTGTAYVFLATGMYVGSNGKKIDLHW